MAADVLIDIAGTNSFIADIAIFLEVIANVRCS